MSKLIKLNKCGNWYYLTIRDGGGDYEVHTNNRNKIDYLMDDLDTSKYSVFINDKYQWETSL